MVEALIIQKEKDNLKLSVKLYRNGIINSLGKLFEESNNTKVTNLIGRRVFFFKLFNPDKHKE